jgi:hypothetical protein
MRPVLVILLLLGGFLYAAPPADLPGVELSESDITVEKSKDKVQLVSGVKQEKSTWISPAIADQLGRDRTLIGMGQGAVFFPVMTESRREPEVLLYQGDKIVKQGTHGHRILVAAGDYMAKIGSGVPNQKMNFSVTVQEGHTTVVEALWGGLLIETLDESGMFVEEVYEVYDLNTGESFGKGYGHEEQRRSEIRTWLLPPGMYKITHSEKDFSSPTDYITVQVNAGELSFVEIVFDGQTGNLIAGGKTPGASQMRYDRYWSFRLRMGGAFSYTSNYGVQDWEKEDDNITLLSDLRLMAQYDHANWLGTSEFYAKNNFQWIDENDGNTDTRMRSIVDDLQLRTSLMRRITPWLGPYVRGTIKSHAVNHYMHPNEEDSIFYELNAQYDTVGIYRDSALLLRPPFFPLEFGEGVGLSIQLLNFYTIQSNTQFGAAWRQTLNRKVLIPLKESKTAFYPAQDVYQWGVENTWFFRLQLGRRMAVDVLMEFFAPSANFDNVRIEELSADLRLRIIRNVELSYMHELVDEETEEGDFIYTSRNSFTLRYFLNF